MTNLPINTSFSQKLPLLQLAWDSVSRGAFNTCKRYYQYVIIDGYASKRENVHFTFGIGFHAALELYDRHKANGKTHNESLNLAVRYTIAYTWDYARKRPWLSEEPTKTRETLIRAVIWYLLQFEDDPLETMILNDGKPAVELTFHYNSQLISITDEPYIFCGHLDRVVYWNEKIFIVDRKTTKSSLLKSEYVEKFFSSFKPDDQMSGYYFGGKVIFDKPIEGIIIDAGQTAVTFTKFQRGFTYRTSEELNEWYNDTALMLKEAENCAKTGEYRMNPKACGHYGGCPFRIVCSEPPSMRQELLDAFYIKRVWDPLVTREV